MATLAAAPPAEAPVEIREIRSGTSQAAASTNGGPCLDTTKYSLLSQGAEARVWQGTFLGLPAVVKQRFKKRYRHAALDTKLTAQRLRQEVRSMLRARKLGVPTPALYYVDTETACIYMERVPGHSVKAALWGSGDPAAALIDGAGGEDMVRQMGVMVARLHDGGVVHGDLTTSNVLVIPAVAAAAATEALAAPAVASASVQLVFIDFGLSYFSSIPEDRAVDLYVLERAFTSAHSESGGRLFEAFIEAYRRHSRNWCSTLNKLAEVRMRGRKRAMVG